MAGSVGDIRAMIRQAAQSAAEAVILKSDERFDQRINKLLEAHENKTDANIEALEKQLMQ